MPGRQTVPFGGFRFRVKTGFWLRRWTRFPFYFENFNPSFIVDSERIDAELNQTWLENKEIRFQIRFADATVSSRDFTLPDKQIGEKVSFLIEEVFTAYPGQTIILLPVPGTNGRSVHTLYSYKVREEETLWMWLVGPLVTLGLVVLGAVIQRWLGLFPS